MPSPYRSLYDFKTQRGADHKQLGVISRMGELPASFIAYLAIVIVTRSCRILNKCHSKRPVPVSLESVISILDFWYWHDFCQT